MKSVAGTNVSHDAAIVKFQDEGEVTAFWPDQRTESSHGVHQKGKESSVKLTSLIIAASMLAAALSSCTSDRTIRS
ncbi:MAG: hypothetical protein HW389_2769, partial [Bacteroidetes bacterium]|nr:hypothetical protein [Bacteroidota bacterium]